MHPWMSRPHRSRRVLLAMLTLLPIGSALPAPAQPAGRWVSVDGDMLAWQAAGQPLPQRVGPLAPGDGYYLFDNANALDAVYTVRLQSSEGIETIRPHVEQAARELQSGTGLVVHVAAGTVPPGTQPGPGEIQVFVGPLPPVCPPTSAGCAGVFNYVRNELSGVRYISGSNAWINPVVLGYPADSRQHVISHELGHTLGLAHFDGAYYGGYQVMHSSSYDATSFRDGDFNGIRHQNYNGRIDFIGWGAGARTFSGDASGRYELSGSYAPFTGDFNGDGYDDIFLYGPGSNADALLWSNGDGSFSQTVSVDGISGSYKPVVADYDRNGSDDIFWHTNDGDYDNFWWGGPSRRSNGWTANDVSAFGLQGIYEPFAGDFDGDGYADLFLYGPGGENDEIRWGPPVYTESVIEQLGKSLPEPIPGMLFAPRRTTYSISGTYEPVAADFDGDGYDDIYWYERYGPGDSLWWGRSAARRNSFTSSVAPNSGTYRVVTGDFDGDRRFDLLLTDPETNDGEGILWGSSNRAFESDAIETTRGIPFHVFAGDFNGNDRSDVYGYRAGL